MRYPFLAYLQKVLATAAASCLGLAVLAFLLLLQTSPLVAVIAMVSLAMQCVWFYAIAQLIEVILDIEENTRRAAEK